MTKEDPRSQASTVEIDLALLLDMQLGSLRSQLDLAGLHQLFQVSQGIVGHTNGLVTAKPMGKIQMAWKIFESEMGLSKAMLYPQVTGGSPIHGCC